MQFPFHQYIFPHASMAACMFAFENPNAVTFFKKLNVNIIIAHGTEGTIFIGIKK